MDKNEDKNLDQSPDQNERKAKKPVKLLIFIAVGVLLLLLLPIFSQWSSLGATQDGGEPAATGAPVPKDLLRVLEQYKGEDPDYEGWNRATNGTRPVRYRVSGGGGFTYTTPTTPNTARIMCAGDLMCEPGMSKSVFLNNKFFFESCFAKVRKVFDAADFAIANLETCVDPDSPYAIDKHKLSDRFHCNAPTEFLDALRYAGLDAVVMANNHSCDTGATGLYNTVNNVDDSGLLHTGAFTSPDDRRYLLVDINGIKVAFFSYSQRYNNHLDELYFTPEGSEVMLNLYSREKLEKDLKDAREEGAEFTIVYIHFWCKDYPDGVTDRQISTAQEIAEAGADCIIGGHPHMAQPYDEILLPSGKRVPVVYSLGNFITSDKEISRMNYIYELFLERGEDGAVRIADEKVIPCNVMEFPVKGGFVVYPTPKNWRDGVDNEQFRKAEETVMLAVGDKIGIDTNDPA